MDGRVAVVTGALGILGPVWAEALLEVGATVVGLDLPQAAPNGAFARLQAAYPERLTLVGADVTDRDALVAARDRVLSSYAVPAVLVNNAGIDAPPGAEAGDFSRTLEVNVTGLYNATEVFGEAMCAVGGGSIVNIGSLYASVAPIPAFYDHIDPPFTKPAAYGASKAAVVNLTRHFARLWGPHGVRVNALSPGGVLGGQDPEFVRKYSERVPLGRMAEPSDLVGALLFLASDASAYVTGQELRVDGGFTA